MNLARAKSIRPSASSVTGSPNVDSVVAAVRSIWKTAEKAPPSKQAKLKAEIVQTVHQLQSRVEGQVSQPVPTIHSERLLFEEADEEKPRISDRESTPTKTRFPEPALRVYAKDLTQHALQVLPQTAKLRSIDEVRKYLADNLRFNSESTRRRNANYLINRYFPGELFNSDLPRFASAAAKSSALGEALFYLTCRAEKLVALVAEEIVFPALAQGGISRSRIADFVQTQFPNSKSAKQVGVAIISTYQTFGVATATRTRLNVSLREGSLLAFAYVVHLEFPEPGMHTFEQLFNGPLHKWLLWDRDWMVRQLYRLREAGLLSKVSEIDRMRQFTTKFTLADAIQPIVALAEESAT